MHTVLNFSCSINDTYNDDLANNRSSNTIQYNIMEESNETRVTYC